ncbi:hypothetical protein L1987_32928 [Smallanthus sonchifolius]|uniref:Uncharacterized protein n=1 Tax=Smallanthus sonchifolius TaxID=185202 RepID=A0ACB9HS75_9ASTR|nr:hypothetical protein L1987_32928 [Smallanthus sonchifolius]
MTCSSTGSLLSTSILPSGTSQASSTSRLQFLFPWADRFTSYRSHSFRFPWGGTPRQRWQHSHLRGLFKRRHDQGVSDSQLHDFWHSIVDGPYSTSLVESSIRDPLIRYIHRLLACTLIGRRSGIEKCSQLDLFCLYCIVGRREANLASILISSIAKGL